MNVLVVLQGSAYGDERSYNGFRLANNLGQRPDVTVKVFFGDASAAPSPANRFLTATTNAIRVAELEGFTFT